MGLQNNITFMLEDKTYEVSRLTQEIQDKFGLWCESEAFKVLRHTRKNCNDEEYNHLLSEHQSMKRHGKFEMTPGSEAMKYLASNTGFVHMIWLCFRKCSGITELEISELFNKYPDEFLKLYSEEILVGKKNR